MKIVLIAFTNGRIHCGDLFETVEEADRFAFRNYYTEWLSGQIMFEFFENYDEAIDYIKSALRFVWEEIEDDLLFEKKLRKFLADTVNRKNAG